MKLWCKVPKLHKISLKYMVLIIVVFAVWKLTIDAYLNLGDRGVLWYAWNDRCAAVRMKQ